MKQAASFIKAYISISAIGCDKETLSLGDFWNGQVIVISQQ